ncbi:uncharacterized protein LOC109596812 [Aethina tumida]|uniref:uncharacterized protein LOC109596812 n=1 Tax=Aethina tumida TaxID=116153 RepID=UPI00096B3EF6|nr:uncharacterized protein LOC109596812 [Aethina tumida]
MMGSRNMLSVKKVKLHGMTSTKWTTKDKITQYKGLINLYTRDKSIMEADAIVEQKKQYKDLKKLQRNVEKHRKELDNAIGGDKQQLRNTLREHKEMQMAYENLPSKKVIETVNHLAFNKRKEYDRLNYRMKLRSQKYVELKMYASVLSDNLNYDFGKSKLLPEEKQAQIITGKVQDAILKREAALAIRQTYTQIIDIMKKDALYFDAILNTIEHDGLLQGKCMINATKLGQLATEYLDDRRQEFIKLEKQVKKDMQNRKKDLSIYTEEEMEFSNNIKYLLRRDSDINVGRVDVEDPPNFDTLQQDYANMEKLLEFLKRSVLAPTFDDIFPCLQEQERQRQRLEEMTRQAEENRETLLTKYNHGQLMKIEMENTMIETTSQYNVDKVELQQRIEDLTEEKRQISLLTDARYHLLAEILISLKELVYLARLINVEDKRSRDADAVWDERGPPEPEETDGVKIIDTLIKAYSKLMSNVKGRLVGPQIEEGFTKYEKLMNDVTATIDLSEVMIEESLVEDMHIDLHVLSRDDIKRQSAEIVAMNQKRDDM